MSVDGGHIPRNTTLQPLSTDLWWYNRPEISPRLYSQWKRDAQELVSHVKTHLLSQNLVATKSNTRDGYSVKREDRILPATQVKGACLSMKPPHQILRNPMPHGEWGIRRKSSNPCSLKNTAYRDWVLEANNSRRKVDLTPWPRSLSPPCIWNQKLLISTCI